MASHLRLPNHESHLPSLSANHEHTKISSYSSSLSFCLGSSLAVAKRITWEQTPWVCPNLDFYSRQHIEHHLSLHLGRDLPRNVLNNALLLGKCYEPTTRDARAGFHPQLFLLFPNLQRDVLINEKFLTFWHDEVMRPAFRRAWEDSGLIQVEGEEEAEFAGRMTMPGGHGGRAATGKRVFPASGILNHLRHRSTRRVFARWPEWHDTWERGYEGKYSDMRAKVFGEAWQSITGMVSGDRELENPLLLLVWRRRTDFSEALSHERVYEAAGERWDRFIDARFAVPGSFKVLLETVLVDGTQPEN